MCDTPNGFGVREMVTACKGLFAAPRVEQTAAETKREMRDLRHGIDLLELHFARLAADFAVSPESEWEDSLSPVNWIRHNCKMSGHAAAQSVCVGEQMAHLPASTSAMLGVISGVHISH